MRLVLIACLALAACQSNPFTPQVVVKEVQIPVPERCKPDIGPEPNYPDTDAALKASPDLFNRTQRLLAGRLMRIARDQVKSAALAGCAG